MCAYMSGVGSRNQSPFTLLADRVPVHSSMWCCRKRSEEGQSLRDLVTYHGFITQEASLPFISLEGGPLLYERELGGQKELGKALENYLSTLLHFHSSIPPLPLCLSSPSFTTSPGPFCLVFLEDKGYRSLFK